MATSDMPVLAPLVGSVRQDRRLKVQMAGAVKAQYSPLASDAAGEQGECQRACAAPLDELIAHIIHRHHRQLRDLLLRAWTLLDQLTFEVRRGCDAPQLIRDAFEVFVDQLVDCMRREQRSVFPQLQRRTPGGALSSATSLADAVHAIERRQTNCVLAMRRVNEVRGAADAALQRCPVFSQLSQSLEALSSELFQYLFEVNCVLFKRAKIDAVVQPSDSESRTAAQARFAARVDRAPRHPK